MARYQKIQSQIWQDEKFITLSHDAQFLFLYTLTSPHSNSIGLYVLPKQYICADLNWDMKRLSKPFKELLENNLILYDEAVKLICIKNQLKHNPLENENQAKSIAKIIKTLPKSSLYSTILEQLTKRYHEPLRRQLRIQYAKPEAEAEAETETETEAEAEDRNSSTVVEPSQKKLNENIKDEEWLEGLKGNPAYTSLDVDICLGKMIAWCNTNGKKATRKRFVNWLNREERPLQIIANGSNNKPLNPIEAYEQRMKMVQQNDTS